MDTLAAVGITSFECGLGWGQPEKVGKGPMHLSNVPPVVRVGEYTSIVVIQVVGCKRLSRPFSFDLAILFLRTNSYTAHFETPHLDRRHCGLRCSLPPSPHRCPAQRST